MNTAKERRKRLHLDVNKVQHHINTLAQLAEPVQVPPRDPHLDINGGWCDPTPIEGREADEPQSHYMRIVGRAGTNPDHVTVVSLCGLLDGEGDRADLIDCDPLAMENCKTCRAILLAQRRLI